MVFECAVACISANLIIFQNRDCSIDRHSNYRNNHYIKFVNDYFLVDSIHNYAIKVITVRVSSSENSKRKIYFLPTLSEQHHVKRLCYETITYDF